MAACPPGKYVRPQPNRPGGAVRLVGISSSRPRRAPGTRRRRPVIETVGGHAWITEYSEWEREYYDHLDTGDEGLTVDVVDVPAAATHGESFVETPRAHPADPDPDSEGPLPPRLGLFVGRLPENLETGLGCAARPVH